MTETRLCPKCQAPLAPDSLGLCPRCLLAVGLEPASAPDLASTSAQSKFVPPAPAELARHFPQLEIVEMLGSGGMGAVYKARQKNLDRVVALKVLPPAVAAEHDFAERFAREARALARLNHPNIVAIHDFGESDGLYYFLMEYVDGANLRQLMAAHSLRPAEALALVPQICDALQFAHDEGIVHRDIKPENVLVDRKGRVRIADFGLAKLLDVPPDERLLTASRQVMGTPHYMAPEQIENPQHVDHRADIYSLGVVFYEMLTGELPLGRFPPPSKKVQVDVRLDEVVLRALEKEPEHRYQRASDVKVEMESLNRAPAAAAAQDSATAAYAVQPSAGQLDPYSQVRTQVRLPAVALIVTSLFSCVGTAGFVLVFGYWLAASDGTGLPPPFNSPKLLTVLSVAFVIPTVILAGAIRMFNLSSHRWATVGSLLAVVTSPCGLLGLPIGVWCLVVLRRPEVQAAFASQASTEPTSAPHNRMSTDAVGASVPSSAAPVQPITFSTASGASTIAPLTTTVSMADGLPGAKQQVRGPAIGLIVTALVNWFGTILLLPILALVPVQTVQVVQQSPLDRQVEDSGTHSGSSVEQTDRPGPPLGPFQIAVVLGALFGVPAVMLVAGLKMQRLEAWRLAVTASVLCIVVSPGSCIGFPVGIWSLVVLLRDEVRSAFAARAMAKQTLATDN